MADELDADGDYTRRLYDRLMEALVTMDADDGGVGGFVQPHLVRSVLAEVAASVDHNCQTARTPRDRRLFGEEMGKRYTTFLKALDDNAAEIGWPKATKIELGTVN